MDVELKSIPVTLNFDFGQFLDFFKQLRTEEKKFIVHSLEQEIQTPEVPEPDWKSLKSSVLRYDLPFEPVGVEDWEVLQ